MIFAFLLLSALIITEYTIQPVEQNIVDQSAPIVPNIRAETQPHTHQKNSHTKIQAITTRFEFITLTPVLFDFDQSKLSHPAKESLDEIVTFISTKKGVKRLFIEGNTDQSGSNSYNDRLSDHRANSVKKYLLEKGVPKKLLSETGYGEMRPIDEYWTRNGKQRNRHVSLHILVSKSIEQAP